MTIHLTSSIARNIAEAAWGRGDTVAQRTTRRGAYFLTCDQGFGFVLDDACLSLEERRAMLADVAIEVCESRAAERIGESATVLVEDTSEDGFVARGPHQGP